MNITEEKLNKNSSYFSMNLKIMFKYESNY